MDTRDIIRMQREFFRSGKTLEPGFRLGYLKKLRKDAPEILTSVTTAEVVPLLFRQKTHTLPSSFKRKIIFQIPRQAGPVKVVTPSFVDAMHKRDAIVMVWTINEEAEMRELFNMGVDTVMTDDPATVIKVAKELGIRQ